MVYKAKGVLRFDKDWAILDCGTEISKYYCNLHNRTYPYKQRLIIPRSGAHISIIRGEKKLDWRLINNVKYTKLTFYYSTEMLNNDIFFWLPVTEYYQLDNIRNLFGLRGLADDKVYNYHLTVATISTTE